MTNYIETGHNLNYPVIDLPYRKKFLLSQHVAAIYGVETKIINRVVKRNPDKFPSNYYFVLNDQEKEQLFKLNLPGINSKTFNRARPKAFTWEGCNMLAMCLRSERATKRALVIINTITALEREAIKAHYEEQYNVKIKQDVDMDNIDDMILISTALERATSLIRKQTLQNKVLTVSSELATEKNEVLECKAKVLASAATLKSAQQRIADHYGLSYREAMRLMYDKFKIDSIERFSLAIDVKKLWKTHRKEKGNSTIPLYKYLMYVEPEYGELFAQVINSLLAVDVDRTEWDSGFKIDKTTEKVGEWSGNREG